MDAIISALKEELKQATKLINRYKKELSSCFKGSFFTRKIGNNIYGYITKSAQGKIHQNYLGKLSKEAVAKYKDQMLRKKKLEKLYKKAFTQKEFLEKAIRHARKKG